MTSALKIFTIRTSQPANKIYIFYQNVAHSICEDAPPSPSNKPPPKSSLKTKHPPSELNTEIMVLPPIVTFNYKEHLSRNRRLRQDNYIPTYHCLQPIFFSDLMSHHLSPLTPHMAHSDIFLIQERKGLPWL